MCRFRRCTSVWPPKASGSKNEIPGKPKRVGPIRVLPGNRQVAFDRPLVAHDGRTMVPLCNLAEAIGYEVEISGDEIVLSGDADKIALTVGQTEITRIADGQATIAKIDEAPHFHEDELYVSVRHLAEDAEAGEHEAKVAVDQNGETAVHTLRYKVEPEKAVRIELGGSDKLPRADNVEVPYILYNQYGEPMSK